MKPGPSLNQDEDLVLGVSAIVRNTGLSKEQIFELINEWQPNVSDEELEAMWQSRPQKLVIQ
jgi:hypothetical protein